MGPGNETAYLTPNILPFSHLYKEIMVLWGPGRPQLGFPVEVLQLLTATKPSTTPRSDLIRGLGFTHRLHGGSFLWFIFRIL